MGGEGLRMRPEIFMWWRQAEEDLVTARANLEMGRYYACAFFSQQASEKALKALYLKQRRELFLSHDMTEMVRDLNAPSNVREAAARLTPHYIISRYPNAANAVPADMYTKGMAEEALSWAGEIMGWVESILRPRG